MMIPDMNTTSTLSRIQENYCGTRELRRFAHVPQRENITQDAQKGCPARPQRAKRERSLGNGASWRAGVWAGEKGGFFSILLTERETVMEREQAGDRDGGGGGRFFQRRRPCRFCIDKGSIDFKDVGLLRNFLTERGRIVPRRISGNCMRHQRELTAAVKRARHIALISFAEER